MKKVLLILSIAAIAISSCKKEEEHCWKCTSTFSGNNVPVRTHDSTLCGFTQTDINLRSDKQFSAPSTTPYKYWELTNCKQQ